MREAFNKYFINTVQIRNDSDASVSCNYYYSITDMSDKVILQGETSVKTREEIIEELRNKIKVMPTPMPTKM